ncbi:Cof-type HAD-IIB family hydrolase [Oscillospiraceae bacterium MB08-C2-2]|nr:Cof-type HAD-IIB family hydrolase [Oscillospiraceae bacterium MB08-C2-2]
MKKDFSGTLLVTDLDGTLVTKEGIPQRNILALKRFVEQGGHLAIATGRSVSFAHQVASQIPINMPCIIFNGGLVYDYTTRERSQEVLLPPGCGAYIKEIIQKFPDTGVLPLHNGGDDLKSEVFFSYPKNDMTSFFPRNSGIDFDQDSNWYKVLFSMKPEQVPVFEEFVNTLGYSNVRFVTTMETLVEMMPLHLSKGEALSVLAKEKNIEPEKVVAIGDYFNDLEMIQMAGLGVTVENAPDEMKKAADLVVGSCENGALADLVEYLEKLPS